MNSSTDGRHGGGRRLGLLHPRVLAAPGGGDRLGGALAGAGEVERVGLAQGDLDRLAGDAGPDRERAPAARLDDEVEPGLLPVGQLEPAGRVGLDPGDGGGGEQLGGQLLPPRVTGGVTGRQVTACSALFKRVSG